MSRRGIRFFVYTLCAFVVGCDGATLFCGDDAPTSDGGRFCIDLPHDAGVKHDALADAARADGIPLADMTGPAGDTSPMTYPIPKVGTIYTVDFMQNGQSVSAFNIKAIPGPHGTDVLLDTGAHNTYHCDAVYLEPNGQYGMVNGGLLFNANTNGAGCCYPYPQINKPPTLAVSPQNDFWYGMGTCGTVKNLTLLVTEKVN